MGRRALLAAAAAGLVGGPAGAEAADKLADTAQWLAYEARLRARLRDGGGGAFNETMARELLAATNAVRATSKAGPCTWDGELATAARAHAADLAARNYVQHVTPEGFDPPHRVGLLARRMIGSASENIAYRRYAAPATTAQMMQLWRDSPRHWANLRRPIHTRAGYGVVTLGERTYAVGLYAQPDGELGVSLPFRVTSELELEPSLSSIDPPSDAFTLSDPADEREVLAFARGLTPRLKPGVYQLGPQRRLEGEWVSVLWGPIFVRL
ncbi:MAG: CAP domain-containing protein [Caulobacteraceae bacterium]